MEVEAQIFRAEDIHRKQTQTIRRLTVESSIQFKIFGKYMRSHGPRTLCNGPETPTQWKSESVTFLPTDLPTYSPG